MAQVVVPDLPHPGRVAGLAPVVAEHLVVDRLTVAVEHEPLVTLPDVLAELLEHEGRRWDGPVAGARLGRRERRHRRRLFHCRSTRTDTAEPVDPIEQSGRSPRPAGARARRPSTTAGRNHGVGRLVERCDLLCGRWDNLALGTRWQPNATGHVPRHQAVVGEHTDYVRDALVVMDPDMGALLHARAGSLTREHEPSRLWHGILCTIIDVEVDEKAVLTQLEQVWRQ